MTAERYAPPLPCFRCGELRPVMIKLRAVVLTYICSVCAAKWQEEFAQ